MGEGFTIYRKLPIYLVYNNLGVKAAAFTSTYPMGRRRHDKNGDAKHTIPRRHGGWRLRAEKHASYLHPQYTVNQLITKKFNTQLQTEHFTHNLLKINWLQTKIHAVKAENENSLCARNARAMKRLNRCDGADDGWQKTDSYSPKARNIGEKAERVFSPSFFQNLADSNNFT